MIQVNLPYGQFRTEGIEGLNSYIEDVISQNKKSFIPNHNVNSLSLVTKLPRLKNIFDEAEIVAIDGMPVIWMGKALGNTLTTEHRATFLDWMPALWSMASVHKWKVFIIGGSENISTLALHKLSKDYPEISFTGHHGYFNKENEENTKVLELISQLKPHILLVGFGMPQQEFWISENQDDIKSNIILPCGGYLDYLVNDKLVPPRWMGRVGLEWLYRFFKNPRRLFKRYFIEPWPLAISFVYKYLQYKIKRKKNNK
jgi:N-acetylglucosaminyldiphosphoundecaprenol N-acetyl-beta-D-mannosaminyltransferase